ncbi:MAG: class I SAM-dependent methyltransferase [Chromatiales bacterium]|nr:class I SAM-dependent methyltransferase [Chromatiales bacterium]
MAQWFQTPPGALLMDQEWRCLEALLEHLFGYHLVQVGCLGTQDTHLTASKIRSHLLVGESQGSAGMAGQNGRAKRDASHHPSLSWVHSRCNQLPIASDSIDVVLLPHTLDFSADPHQVIREVDRILIAEGRVLITTFNPWSLWGLWRLFKKRGGRVPWCGQFVSYRRVTDWLSLLGFEVEEYRPLMFRPPLNYPKLLNRLSALDRWGERFWPFFSGVCVIQAVKRVTPLTPRRVTWKLRARGIGGHVAEPTTRSSSGG